MNSNIILLEDFKTPLTSMSRPSRKKINKKTLVLNDILDQIDLIDTHTHTHTQYSIQKLQNTYTFQCTVS